MGLAGLVFRAVVRGRAGNDALCSALIPRATLLAQIEVQVRFTTGRDVPVGARQCDSAALCSTRPSYRLATARAVPVLAVVALSAPDSRAQLRADLAILVVVGVDNATTASTGTALAVANRYDGLVEHSAAESH